MFSKLAEFFKKSQSPEIVIVSGLPRSGTSMMMKMLEAGGIPPLTDAIRSADADNPKGYYEFERVKQLPKGDFGWLPEAPGKAVKIIAALLPYLPPSYTYKVLFMRRAMPEILASQRQMLVRRGEDPEKISDDEIARLFEKHLSEVYRWMNASEFVRYLDVDYNRMLAAPQPLSEQIAAFLTHPLDVQAMTGVVDPALYRQRG
ncbi:MAG: hypothetical protein OHK0052_22680 [Anaerolineales bacterium]